MVSKFRIPNLKWRRARHSAGNGECVEVASAGGYIAVRDSKDTDGAMLIYKNEEWRQFLKGAKQDDFDLGS